jgi:hypothetical protein
MENCPRRVGLTTSRAAGNGRYLRSPDGWSRRTAALANCGVERRVLDSQTGQGEWPSMDQAATAAVRDTPEAIVGRNKAEGVNLIKNWISGASIAAIGWHTWRRARSPPTSGLRSADEDPIKPVLDRGGKGGRRRCQKRRRSKSSSRCCHVAVARA